MSLLRLLIWDTRRRVIWYENPFEMLVPTLHDVNFWKTKTFRKSTFCSIGDPSYT